MLDSKDYPTEEELNLLLEYGKKPIENREKVINLLTSIWHLGNWGLIIGKNTLELHTGGWSGNEQIIDVLSQTLFWKMYWRKSEAGGHHYFKWKY